MSYYVIYRDILFKLNDGRIILLESGCDNNVWPKYKDECRASIFDDENEYIDYANKFSDPNNQIAKCGGKFISSLDYKNKLLRLLKHPNNRADYFIGIKKLRCVKNDKLNIELNPKEWHDLMNDYVLRDGFAKKYGSDVSFKLVWDYDLFLDDLTKEMVKDDNIIITIIKLRKVK